MIEFTDEFEDTLEVIVQTVEVEDGEDYKGISVGNVLLNKDQVEELIRALTIMKEKEVI
jgi:hypothetical protein